MADLLGQPWLIKMNIYVKKWDNKDNYFFTLMNLFKRKSIVY